MRRLIAALALLSTAAAGAVTAGAVAAGPAANAPLPPVAAGMPAGVPPAAREAEPALPAPRGWPFGEQFPRTSGTGRLAGGATFWTDFLYDDHGAAGHPVDTPVAALAPTDGTYVYASDKAHMNGADIFRAAVGLRDGVTYWRVDWNTLVDPALPVAEWAIDRDDDPATGVDTWPAGAGVHSPGSDAFLVVTSRGARLLDGSGRVVAVLPTTVDRAARSFVVAVPQGELHLGTTSRVRLAAGVANAGGTGFAPVGSDLGANPGQPAVYNVTFRTYKQEPPQYRHGIATNYLGTQSAPRAADLGNLWMEDHQAEALAAGDVTPFSLQVDWSDLAAHRATPEPRPTGYTNRWYVTTLDLGQGVVHDASGGAGQDLRPNFLGRVQPYAVYVPTTYRPGHATPLTWILHSLSVQHNQYGAYDPQLLQHACEDRGSICATTLGFGPDGWYHDEAEVDFWQVWHALARAYTLDPDRTVISGYSMGGYGTYKLGLEYPDLFAKAMPLAGPPQCGLRLVEGAGFTSGPGRCSTDGDTTPLLDSARWLPFVVGQGMADELVPFTSVVQQVQTLDSLGYRYYFELYPAEDHLVWAIQDAFDSEVAQLGEPVRERDPGHVTYTWYPHLSRTDLGIGPQGVYWLRDLRARDTGPGSLAHVDAVNQRLVRPVTVSRTQSARVPGEATPSVVQQLTWAVGPRPDAAPTLLSMSLRNVAGASVDPAWGGWAWRTGHLDVVTDGGTALRLVDLPAGTRVVVRGRTVATAGSEGSATVRLDRGRTIVGLVLPPRRPD